MQPATATLGAASAVTTTLAVTGVVALAVATVAVTVVVWFVVSDVCATPAALVCVVGALRMPGPFPLVFPEPAVTEKVTGAPRTGAPLVSDTLAKIWVVPPDWGSVGGSARTVCGLLRRRRRAG